MAVGRIDHVAITVADAVASADFYIRVLDAAFLDDRKIDGRLVIRKIRLGDAVLNIHQQGNGIALVARLPTPGSVDICFRWTGTLASAKAHLDARAVPIVDGPSPRQDSDGRPSHSVYFHDPDGNLVELMAAD